MPYYRDSLLLRRYWNPEAENDAGIINEWFEVGLCVAEPKAIANRVPFLVAGTLKPCLLPIVCGNKHALIACALATLPDIEEFSISVI